jgi:hypothetical protein
LNIPWIPPALRVQPRNTKRADGYKRRLSLLTKVIDEAAFVGFFPNGQAWTRSAPSFESFGVQPRMRADPFKKIQDQ